MSGGRPSRLMWRGVERRPRRAGKVMDRGEGEEMGWLSDRREAKREVGSPARPLALPTRQISRGSILIL